MTGEKKNDQHKKLQAHQLYFVSWENHEVILPGVNQSCMTNLISFCDKMTVFSDKEREVDIIYLNFSKVFNTDSHKIFISNLGLY